MKILQEKMLNATNLYQFLDDAAEKNNSLSGHRGLSYPLLNKTFLLINVKDEYQVRVNVVSNSFTESFCFHILLVSFFDNMR